MGKIKVAKEIAEGIGSVAKKVSQYGLTPERHRPTTTPRTDRLPTPSVHTKGDEPTVRKILDYAAENPAKYSKATEPVFGPADPKLTKEIVEQRSVAGDLPPYPDPGKALPAKDRARVIHENRDAIARQLVKRIESVPEMPFYSTGSVYTGLTDLGGLSMPEAKKFMWDWAGQGAGTSPRTRTPPNLRNAAYLMWRRAQGEPLTGQEMWELEGGNRKGFPMIGDQHPDLANRMATGEVDPWNNPKPYTFRENWMGNMADVTSDTHNIRATLDAFDRLYPGELPRQWFDKQDNYDAYVGNVGFPSKGPLPDDMAIKDTLSGAMIPGTGRYAQTEYPILQWPTAEAGRMLDISPAEAQERLWFGAGERTGLKSPPMTIPDLFNAQFEATARATGLAPETIMRLFANRKIPLAEADVSDVPGYSTVG